VDQLTLRALIKVKKKSVGKLLAFNPRHTC
jgi:hypothetical protein